MKRIIILLAVLFTLGTNLNAQSYFSNLTSSGKSSYYSTTNATYVKGYQKSNGTYVNGYYRTPTNKTTTDNFSTKGNYNPYTSKVGYRPNNYSQEANNYGQGRSIQTGPKGGQYYINSNGNKTYVPKR